MNKVFSRPAAFWIQEFAAEAGRCLVAALLGGLGFASAAAASDYASVSTQARFINPLTGPLHVLPSCVSSFSRGLRSESTGALTCNAGAAGNHAGFEVSASARGPSSGTLPLLGAAARVLVPQGSPVTTFTEASAEAYASFRDYVILSETRPTLMTFDFALSGALGVQGPPQATSAWSRVDISTYAQSGSFFGSSSFGSFSPFGRGGTAITTVLSGDQSTQSTVEDRPGNSSDFSFTVLAPGQFQLELGPSFLGNLLNTHVLLDFGLFAQATLRAQMISGDQFAFADFANTLTMTEVHAFDALGNDVTTDAFLGFQSANVAPIPEPTTALLFGSGMAWLAWRRRAALRAGSGDRRPRTRAERSSTSMQKATQAALAVAGALAISGAMAADRDGPEASSRINATLNALVATVNQLVTAVNQLVAASTPPTSSSLVTSSVIMRAPNQVECTASNVGTSTFLVEVRVMDGLTGLPLGLSSYSVEPGKAIVGNALLGPLHLVYCKFSASVPPAQIRASMVMSGPNGAQVLSEAR